MYGSKSTLSNNFQDEGVVPGCLDSTASAPAIQSGLAPLFMPTTTSGTHPHIPTFPTLPTHATICQSTLQTLSLASFYSDLS
jgi:hypothetical protein